MFRIRIRFSRWHLVPCLHGFWAGHWWVINWSPHEPGLKCFHQVITCSSLTPGRSTPGTRTTWPTSSSWPARFPATSPSPVSQSCVQQLFSRYQLQALVRWVTQSPESHDWTLLRSRDQDVYFGRDWAGHCDLADTLLSFVRSRRIHLTCNMTLGGQAEAADSSLTILSL